MRNSEKFRLSRLVRTNTSEAYVIWEQESRIGLVHIHYAHDIIHAAILLEVELTVPDEETLLESIDDDIVSSYMPSFEREDFFVTIYKAEEISSFSYSSTEMDDYDDEDEEEDYD